MRALALAAWLVSPPSAPPSPPAPPASPPPRVVAVRLDTRPEDAELLGRYLEMAPGDVLQPEVVRHVVELFYATGEFADVRVETLPRPEGVEVVFHLLHAPLLRQVR